MREHSMLSVNDGAFDARTRILKAALEVFAESGFAGGSTREIARRAGVHQPAILYHFQNKNELWKATVDAIFSEFSETLDAGLRHEKDRTKARRALVHVFIEFVAEHPEWFTFMVHEGLQDGARTAWLVERWARPVTFKLLNALGMDVSPKGNDAGTQKAMSVITMLTGAASIFSQMVIIRKLSGVDVTSATFIRQHMFLVDSMLEHLLCI